MSVRLPRISLLLFLLLVLSVGAVQAQNGGITVQGVIQNGTQGAALPENLPVTLYTVADADQTGLYETTSDANGEFAFEDVELVDGAQLIAVATYLDVPYYSDSFIYAEGQAVPKLALDVYETTQDMSSVSIVDLTVLLNEVDGMLRVGEYYLISNGDDHTWIGTDNVGLGTLTTSAFSLPEGAQNLWFSGRGLGDRFLETEEGFVDTAPVLPGTELTEVFFSYELPIADAEKISRTMYLPVEAVAFMVSELGGVTVSGEGITDTGPVETDSGPALTYAGQPVSAGSDLVFSVNAQDGAAISRNGLEIGIAVVVLAVALVTAYLIWRKPSGRKWPEEAQPILAAIAQLDDQIDGGELSEAEYHQKRIALLEKLKLVLQQTR
ncbi:hypothetical protein KQH56_01530 [bacterium]|nr:hypothetical protein [bacterium]